MSNFFPTDPKKIREHIKRYKHAFRERHHDDGAGKRFLLGQFYMDSQASKWGKPFMLPIAK